jgi:CRP/FNR family transcriptional regulator, cyclic AMP receptor protein
MIGTTRSRVSFFMNRFRKLGFIEYNGRIKVHRSLLKVALHDHLPDQSSTSPLPTDIPRNKPGGSKHARTRQSVDRTPP